MFFVSTVSHNGNQRCAACIEQSVENRPALGPGCPKDPPTDVFNFDKRSQAFKVQVRDLSGGFQIQLMPSSPKIRLEEGFCLHHRFQLCSVFEKNGPFVAAIVAR
jgi:hypothetical protein